MDLIPVPCTDDVPTNGTPPVQEGENEEAVAVGGDCGLPHGQHTPLASYPPQIFTKPVQCTDDVGRSTELVPEGQGDTRERLSPGHVRAPCSRSHQPHHLKTKRGVTVTEVCEDDKTEARCRQLYAENTRLRQLSLCHCCSTIPFYAVILPCKHFVCFPCMCCMWPLCPLHKCHRRVERHVLVRFK